MEPQAKRRPGREISFSELQSLSYAIAHFPPRTPLRWQMISEYVKSMANSRDTILYGINGSERRFDCSHADCQVASNLLGSDIPEVRDFLGPFFRGSDSKSFMPVILLPPVSQCCGNNLLIRNRPFHARVYTTHGTDIAAVFTGECKSPNCRKRYYYSYMESVCSGQAERYYYSLMELNQPYFQVTSKTVFSIDYLEDVSLNLEISWASFESRAKVHNEKFSLVDRRKFESIAQHLRMSDEPGEPWLLYDQRLVEGWFIWKVVLYFDSRKCLLSVGFSNFFSSTSHCIDLESMCSMVWQDILSSPNEWIHHSYTVNGCKEGYVTIDGLEKVTCTICAAPKEKRKLPHGFPNIIQCCHNSLMMGGKFAKASKSPLILH